MKIFDKIKSLFVNKKSYSLYLVFKNNKSVLDEKFNRLSSAIKMCRTWTKDDKEIGTDFVESAESLNIEYYISVVDDATQKECYRTMVYQSVNLE